MLNAAQAADWTRDLLEMRTQEREFLDNIHAYWRGEQPLPIAPSGVPADVTRLAKMSRVNVCQLAVNVPAQSMFVTGFRDEDAPTWAAWQANRMDKHQTAVHRSMLAYGTSYVTVMPAGEFPAMRGISPRHMTVAYERGSDWPEVALEVRLVGRKVTYHLYDSEARYTLREDPEQASFARQQYWPVLTNVEAHGAGVCPVVRFQAVDDLDGHPNSAIVPIMPLQDQIDFTTFGLLVAQHFAAFRQRYVIGWTSDDENEKAKASASRLWTFDPEDGAESMKIGEFGQTDLSGYLDSRQSTQELFGIIGQIPPHNLLGKMVNLSADALVAAEVGHSRMLQTLETSAGESWEQAHLLCGRYMGVEVSEGAQVRWRDMEARSLAQTVDALGKMRQMLDVPREALWEKIPGVTQQDAAHWRQLAAADDALGRLFADLDRQNAPVE